MSWQASAYVKSLKVCPSGAMISKTEKLVGLILADAHQIRSDRATYPSVAEMAADALMDERSCRRILGALAVKGVIEILRPDSQGRGQLTSYRFPALELQPAPPEGGHSVPLPIVENAPPFSAKRGAKGGQKGDKTRTPLEPLLEEQEQKPETTAPQTPTLRAGAAGGAESSHPARERAAEEVRRHADAVVQACGFSRCRRRIRRVIEDQLRQEQERGKSPATAQLQMIAKWKLMEENRHLLRHDWGAENFFGEGCWREGSILPWDQRQLREDRNRVEARVGMV